MRFESDGVRFVAAPEFLTNFLIRHAGDFPSAVEVFEARSTETVFRKIPKDQILLRNGAVESKIPGLANLEVAQQVFGWIRLQGNSDEIAEYFRCLPELRVVAREEQEIEFRKLPKERPIGLQVMCESGEIPFRARELW